MKQRMIKKLVLVFKDIQLGLMSKILQNSPGFKSTIGDCIRIIKHKNN